MSRFVTPVGTLGHLLSFFVNCRIVAWQHGALLTAQHNALVSVRCLPTTDGGIDLCLVAVTSNTVRDPMLGYGFGNSTLHEYDLPCNKFNLACLSNRAFLHQIQPCLLASSPTVLACIGLTGGLQPADGSAAACGGLLGAPPGLSVLQPDVGGVDRLCCLCAALL